MDHSIFGSLMDVNGGDNDESYSNEDLYIDEQSSSYDPESSSNYHAGPYTEENDYSSGSNGKKSKGRPKKLNSKFKELRFKCQQCDYKTWKKSNFQRHLGTHNKKLYKCTLCPFSGKHADDLQKHIICHKKKETTGNIDVNHFALVQKLIKKEPIRIMPNNRSGDDVIKKVIKSEPQDDKLKEEPVACSPAVEVYLDEQSNSNSMIAESSLDEDYDSDTLPAQIKIDPLVSNQLKRSSLTVTPVIRGVSIFNVGRPSSMPRNDKELRFSCPYCSYRTWKTSNFQRHLCTHTTERPYKCHLCKYSGKHHEDLKKHMICHTNKFAPTMYIANNETAVIPINPTIAPVNRVVNNENVPEDQSPLGNNNNAKRFTCLLCEFQTNRSSALTRHHFVVHNDYRPFACDLCPYRSKLRDSLKKHMMSHTDERPFECEICHHRCRQKGDLKRHQLLHTGERPFACPHCPYRSNRTQLLKKHISRRHDIPHISSEITVTKTTMRYEDFGSHYLAGMF